MAVKGIDVSYYQGDINWKSVANNGIKFVIPRSGYGKSTIDKKFLDYVKGAKANGVDIPGTYHFSYAYTIEMAKAEADFAVSCAKKAELPTSTVIFFDFEYDSVDYAKKQGVVVGSNLCIALTHAFCSRVTELGYKPGVYANVDFWKRFYNNGTGVPSGAVFWLADWTGGPDVPSTYHQYSEKGKIPGINGSVDLDYYYGTISEPEKLKEANPEIVNAVINGAYGNGETRKQKLTEAGFDYESVQAAVNEKMKEINASKPATPFDDVVEVPKKAVTQELVRDIIAGKYGNGDERVKLLTEAGYDYDKAQKAVDDFLKASKPNLAYAKSFNKSISGRYKVTAGSLNMRYQPGVLTAANVVTILNQGTVVQCYGYYTQLGNSKWYLIQSGKLVGFVDSKYLTKA